VKLFKCFMLPVLAGVSGIAVAAGITAISAKNSTSGQQEEIKSTLQALWSFGQLLAGEDQINGVMKTEQQFSYCAGIVADGQCGSPAGFLHSVTCASDDPAATAGSMAIRDATAASTGTIIQNVNFAAAFLAPVTMIFDVVLTTGLYLDFTTTADVECSASYR